MFATADLYDEYGNSVEVLAPIFRDFGGVDSFSGEIETLKVYEDNSLVRSTLESAGRQRVLVVDGQGSLKCALVGDNLASLALANGWAGLLIFGCVRDSSELCKIPIGIKALATNPRKSIKKGDGIRNTIVAFADSIIIPGHFIYADRDGVLLSGTELG
jgi:regulator of ribonuclease activity A